MQEKYFYLKDLLYSLMLPSHNDTAVAIAEHVSGSTAKFVKLMNKKQQRSDVRIHISQPQMVWMQGITITQQLLTWQKFPSMQSKSQCSAKLVRTGYYSFSNLKHRQKLFYRHHQCPARQCSGSSGYENRAILTKQAIVLSDFLIPQGETPIFPLSWVQIHLLPAGRIPEHC